MKNIMYGINLIWMIDLKKEVRNNLVSMFKSEFANSLCVSKALLRRSLILRNNLKSGIKYLNLIIESKIVWKISRN